MQSETCFPSRRYYQRTVKEQSRWRMLESINFFREPPITGCVHVGSVNIFNNYLEGRVIKTLFRLSIVIIRVHLHCIYWLSDMSNVKWFIMINTVALRLAILYCVPDPNVDR